MTMCPVPRLRAGKSSVLAGIKVKVKRTQAESSVSTLTMNLQPTIHPFLGLGFWGKPIMLYAVTSLPAFTVHYQ